jgi:hypothetical protein
MVDKIEIMIPNYSAIINEGKSFINDREVEVKENDIEEIVRIIRDWKQEYKARFAEDIYTIRVFAEDEEVTYRFYSAFPDDFYLLVDYLGVLYDRG